MEAYPFGLHNRLLTVDEAGLDPTHIANRSDAEANLADLIDQAISAPLSEGDHPVKY
jgi:hypothetical protein